MKYSIINLLNLEKTSTRIDSEYYHPNNLHFLEVLNRKPLELIGNFCKVTDGIHTSIDFDESSHINLVSAMAPKENYFDLSSSRFISEKQNNANSRTQFDKGDVIISVVGTIGNCAVVTDKILPANADRDVGIIKIKNHLYPRFLSTFLLSKYGRFQTIRESTGNVQLHLFIYKIKEIQVPQLALYLQEFIEKCILESERIRHLSKCNYKDAENLLLEALGLDKWQAKEELNFVNNFSHVQSTDRFDAEYFQPMNEEIEKKIKNYEGGWDKSKNLIRLREKNFAPKENIIYKYIELANISSQGEITGFTECFGKELPSRARRKVEEGEVVISTIEGSLERIALIKNIHNEALCSTGFFVIKSEVLNPETLFVFFKSIAGQMQLKKRCNGTILSAISKDEFNNIYIPKIRIEVQENIKNLIQEMYELKSLSKSLLETAKIGVEKAIEEDEEKAMDWMNGELDRLKIKFED